MDIECIREGLLILLRQPGGMPIVAWDKFWLANRIGDDEDDDALARMMHRLAADVKIGYWTDANGVESESRRVWLPEDWRPPYGVSWTAA